MSPTRRLAVTDVGRFASGEVSGNADREWRLLIPVVVGTDEHGGVR